MRARQSFPHVGHVRPELSVILISKAVSIARVNGLTQTNALGTATPRRHLHAIVFLISTYGIIGRLD